MCRDRDMACAGWIWHSTLSPKTEKDLVDKEEKLQLN